MAAPSEAETSGAISRHAETQAVGHIDDANSSNQTAHSASLTSSDSATASTSFPADRASSFPGWLWFVVGAVLLVGTPFAIVLCFLGLAGLLVGCTLLFVDLNWHAQLIAFALGGVASAMLWQQLDRSSRNKNDLIGQSFRGRGPYALVGRVFRLQKPIVGGVGVLTIGDIPWRIAGTNCAAGKRVKVVHAEGTLLIVDPLET